MKSYLNEYTNIISCVICGCVCGCCAGLAVEQCSGAFWRVFSYGVITATIFLVAICVVTVIALRCGRCFRSKAHDLNSNLG